MTLAVTTEPVEHDEIEITEEMIKAGVEAYDVHARALKNNVPGEEEELVKDVFRCMRLLAKGKNPIRSLGPGIPRFFNDATMPAGTEADLFGITVRNKERAT